MIQRLQTVYLAVSAMLMGIFMLSPLFVVSNGSLFAAMNCKMGLGFAGLFTAGAVANIFLYRNRALQATIGWVLLVANVLIVFFYGVHYYFLSKGLVAGETLSIKPFPLIPIITLVFIYLAIRGINKDEQLVKESDRLR